MTKTRLYNIWAGMKARCTKPTCAEWRYYGARGITYIAEWERFEPFAEWALNNGYSDSLSLDRIDNDGPYAPENCRWATDSQQARNRRPTRLFTAWGETKSMKDWTNDPRMVVAPNIAYNRMHSLGWTFEDALSTPPGTRTRWKRPSA